METAQSGYHCWPPPSQHLLGAREGFHPREQSLPQGQPAGIYIMRLGLMPGHSLHMENSLTMEAQRGGRWPWSPGRIEEEKYLIFCDLAKHLLSHSF